MSSVQLLLELSGYKKPPKIEFNPDGLPFKLTVKHIKGMVQVETDIAMKDKSVVGPDGEFHADSVAWEKTGWKSGDTLRIVDKPPVAPSNANSSSDSSTERRPSQAGSRSSSKKSPLVSGGSLMLSGNRSPHVAETFGKASGEMSYEATDIQTLLEKISAGDLDVAHTVGTSSDNIAKTLGSATQHADSKLRSRSDLKFEAERKALQVLQAQQSELTSRSEACLLKLQRLKALLKEDHEGDDLIAHWAECDLSVPTLPILSKWNSKDFMSYLRQIAVLQTQLESWSSEASAIAGDGLSADVLRQQVPQCTQFVALLSTFVITCFREAAEAGLHTLGQGAKSVWDEWHALEGAKDLDKIHEVKHTLRVTKPAWFEAPDEIVGYLDEATISHNPGSFVMSKIKQWLEAVPFSSKKVLSDVEYYADPDSFYWKRLTIRQRAVLLYLLEQAEQEDDAFHQALESIVSCVPDAGYKRGPVKKVERTSAKIVTWEKGDAFQIRDFHRALVVCPTPEHAVASFRALEQAGSHIEIAHCKNGFINDYWGYNLKLAMVSIKVSGVLGEVQICPSEMFHIRDMMHHYYDFARASSVDDFR